MHAQAHQTPYWQYHDLIDDSWTDASIVLVDDSLSPQENCDLDNQSLEHHPNNPTH